MQERVHYVMRCERGSTNEQARRRRSGGEYPKQNNAHRGCGYLERSSTARPGPGIGKPL
jgi:hypothetical protein